MTEEPQTYIDETVSRSRQFAEDLLRLIPELEGVAVVPSFSVQAKENPYGLIIGRNGAMRNPAEIMHMAQQLHGCLQVNLQNAFAVLKQVDDHMADRQERLQELEDRIGRAEQKLQESP